MRDLLLEIGLEEMPARFITDAMNQLGKGVEMWLMDNRIPFGSVTTYSTPRRLAVRITEVVEKQKDIEEEAKGPARKIATDGEGNWTKAALGFVRGQGANLEDIFFKELKGIEYAHVMKFQAGQETEQLLGGLQSVITGLHFPVNMRWGSNDLRFVRPIHWLVALYGETVIPMEIAGVTSGRETRGHRFLGEEIQIQSAHSYEEQLKEQYVIVNPTLRKKMITEQKETLATEKNWLIPTDEDLLEEVNNLVEYPTVFFGRFSEEFLAVPVEVLITSMKEHQRYFPVTNKEGKLLPHFVAVRNGDSNHIDNVVRGNEKVLQARLSDAAFFYTEDMGVTIEAYLEKLSSIVFHDELGTITDKVARFTTLSESLAEQLTFDENTKRLVKRTAEIAKFDLVTKMVGEFPELQGVMGEKYARMFGEKEAVAKAINEHYMPKNATDSTPPSDIGAVVSIADKLDTIVGSFSIGLIPTGSQDPYALRRASSGIVQILLDKAYPLPLEKLLQESIQIFAEKGLLKRNEEEVLQDLLNFFQLRLKNTLSEKGLDYDIAAAVLNTPIGRLTNFVRRGEVLQAEKQTEGFKEIIESLTRVCNIAKNGTLGEVNPSLFEHDAEQKLYDAYTDVKANFCQWMAQGKIEENFQKLASLQQPIDDYFENVMVMSDKEAIKANRLIQMAELANIILTFADVKEIIV